MTDDLYTRQQPLQLYVPDSVCVVGVGGIGSWVAIFAAMSGVPNVFMFDPDMMENHNRNRLPFCVGSLQRPKVDVVREYIEVIRPDCHIAGVTAKLEDEEFEGMCSLTNTFIDCTDSPKAQIHLYNLCKQASKIYIRAGYDGTHISVASHISGWVKPEEEADYTVAPSWVVPAATVAALAVGKLMKYPNQEISLDISEIGIPVLKRQGRITQRCQRETQ